MQEWLSGICPVMRDDVNLSHLFEGCGEGGGGDLVSTLPGARDVCVQK